MVGNLDVNLCELKIDQNMLSWVCIWGDSEKKSIGRVNRKLAYIQCKKTVSNALKTDTQNEKVQEW